MDPFLKVMMAGGGAYVLCKVLDAIWPTATKDKIQSQISNAMITIIFTIAIATSLIVK